MKVVGLTGGTGSGKSVVSRYLKTKGAHIVDADAIAHKIIEKGQPAYIAIVQYFGNEILDDKGEIVRKKLGEIVFSDSEKLNRLNQYTHYYIHQEIANKIEYYKQSSEGGIIILDAPLFSDRLAKMCNQVWVLFAHEQSRINRIMNRDNITYEQAKNRVRNQQDFEAYQKFATHVIDNSNDETYLLRQVDALVSTIL